MKIRLTHGPQWMVIVFTMLSFTVWSQTTLSPGDIMFIGINSDAIGSPSADEFDVLFLEPVVSGTVIYFTDFGYTGNSAPYFQQNPNNGCASGTGAVSDGIIKWTATSAVSAGTQLVIRVNVTSGSISASTGSLSIIVETSTAGDGMSLSSAGEAVHAFQGTINSSDQVTSATMIASIDYDALWTGTVTICQFSSTVSENPNTGYEVEFATHNDNGYYSGSKSGDKATLQAAILNQGNWTPASNYGYNLPITGSFSVSGGATPVSASITAQTNVACNGASTGSLTATATDGTANFDYTWSNSSFTSNTSSTTNTISGLVAGTYTVTITDGNGDTSSVSATITQPAPITVSITQDNGLCFGSPVEATASATGGNSPYSYAWSNGDSTASISGVAYGYIYVIVTDANGCSGGQSITFTKPRKFAVDVVVDSNASCNGLPDGGLSASISYGVSPFTYLWSNAATTASITGLAAGTYTVNITDANGCITTDSGTVSNLVTVVASAAVSSTLDCNGDTDGQVTASATGGTSPYTYSWNTGGTAALETGLSAGTYSVTITDNNGCWDSASVTLTEPTALVASATVSSTLDCNGDSDGQVTASGTGGTSPYIYSWNTGGTAALETSLGAGTYSVTITDANGCTASNSVTLTQPATLVASSSLDSDVTCNGGADGGVTASATGGSSPYTYLWNNSATTATISGVAAGTYTVTVTDANGCTSTSSKTVTEPSASTGGEIY